MALGGGRFALIIFLVSFPNGGDALDCTSSANGINMGATTCQMTSETADHYGNMCWRTALSGFIGSGCTNLCASWGTPTTCCSIPGSGQKIICSATDFAGLPAAADFTNCDTACVPNIGLLLAAASRTTTTTSNPAEAVSEATALSRSNTLFVLLGSFFAARA